MGTVNTLSIFFLLIQVSLYATSAFDYQDVIDTFRELKRNNKGQKTVMRHGNISGRKALKLLNDTDFIDSLDMEEAEEFEALKANFTSVMDNTEASRAEKKAVKNDVIDFIKEEVKEQFVEELEEAGLLNEYNDLQNAVEEAESRQEKKAAKKALKAFLRNLELGETDSDIDEDDNGDGNRLLQMAARPGRGVGSDQGRGRGHGSGRGREGGGGFGAGNVLDMFFDDTNFKESLDVEELEEFETLQAKYTSIMDDPNATIAEKKQVTKALRNFIKEEQEEQLVEAIIDAGLLEEYEGYLEALDEAQNRQEKKDAKRALREFMRNFEIADDDNEEEEDDGNNRLLQMELPRNDGGYRSGGSFGRKRGIVFDDADFEERLDNEELEEFEELQANFTAVMENPESTRTEKREALRALKSFIREETQEQLMEDLMAAGLLEEYEELLVALEEAESRQEKKEAKRALRSFVRDFVEQMNNDEADTDDSGNE